MLGHERFPPQLTTVAPASVRLSALCAIRLPSSPKMAFVIPVSHLRSFRFPYSSPISVSPRRPRPVVQTSMQTPSPNESSPLPDSSEVPSHTNPPPSPSLDAEVRPVPASDVKQELLGAIAGTNRGFVSTPLQIDTIRALLSDLESANPSKTPLDDPLLCGKWRLIWTDGLDILGLSFLMPIAQIAQINQDIRKDESDECDFIVENVIVFEPFFAPVVNVFERRTELQLTVKAEGKRTDDDRIDIKFVGVEGKGKKLLGWEIPGGALTGGIKVASPVGYIKTTYLDADLRVARAPSEWVRGGEGNVFVLVRDQQ